MKIVDLSGYSFTGKSAVYDLLQEFDGYIGQGLEFEFELIRMPGGILDLECALTKNWSPVRSSEAIRRFNNLISRLGGNGTYIARLRGLGTHYEMYFPGFEHHSQLYLQRLITAEWRSPWPFAYYDTSDVAVFFRKLVARALRFDPFQANVYLSRLEKEKFHSLTKEYLENLIACRAVQGSRAFVLNNAFEPFAPDNSMCFFDDARSIVVDRDPRDVYLAALRDGQVGRSNVGKAVVGNSVDDFIARFRVYRSGNLQQSPRILQIAFESLVLEYEDTVTQILDFLDEEPCIHARRGVLFSPEVSARGVGLWRNARSIELSAIKRIEQDLEEYCI